MIFVLRYFGSITVYANEIWMDSDTDFGELKDCKDNDSVKVEEEDAVGNIDDSLVSKPMEEEEEKLQEEQMKEEEQKENEPIPEPHLNDTQFSKLDELLTQTQLYSEFLLEKMDDITKVSFPCQV